MLYLALEQQRIIAADMVIAEVQKKKVGGSCEIHEILEVNLQQD